MIMMSNIKVCTTATATTSTSTTTSTTTKTKHNMIIIGSDFGEYSNKNNTCSYAIGIVNTTTGIMTVLPASSAYIMKPVIEQHLQVCTTTISSSRSITILIILIQ